MSCDTASKIYVSAKVVASLKRAHKWVMKLTKSGLLSLRMCKRLSLKGC